MKLFKRIFIFIIFLLTFNNITFLYSKTFNMINQGDNLYIKSYFSPDIKVNGKILLFDLTNDILKYISVKETTDDILNSGKYIYKKIDLDRIKNNEKLFSESLKKMLEQQIKKELINVNLFAYNDDINPDAIIISVKIDEYNEGEFNLIKNIPTQIKIFAKIYIKSSKQNDIVIKIKKYKKKSNIDFPIEKLRLEGITNKISIDIVKFLKKFML